ncbi:hypothetical protein NDU88_000272 [Pleurodeles waltl]|uniref:Uncharacterized protein n=1 Tax=Pleurodeles waltl TaxID=8319 RepID=A0AAV7U450_PLEWA|nr:hypothetical protein NDU88_000272 [Pleurodeles waltl]
MEPGPCPAPHAQHPPDYSVEETLGAGPWLRTLPVHHELELPHPPLGGDQQSLYLRGQGLADRPDHLPHCADRCGWRVHLL